MVPLKGALLLGIISLLSVENAYAYRDDQRANDPFELVQDLEKTISEKRASFAATNEEINVLKTRLQQMVDLDQAAREYFDLGFVYGLDGREQEQLLAEIWKRVRDVDLAHQDELNGFLARHGWIDNARFGIDAERHAWLLAQHMVYDGGDFQRKVLSTMRPYVERGDTSPAFYASLFDRVTVIFDKEPQVYGTQGTGQADGTWKPSPIQDQENIDARREAVNLPPFSTEIARMNSNCARSIITDDE